PPRDRTGRALSGAPATAGVPSRLCGRRVVRSYASPGRLDPGRTYLRRHCDGVLGNFGQPDEHPQHETGPVSMIGNWAWPAEPPTRIELVTYSLRVNRSTDRAKAAFPPVRRRSGPM